MSRAGAQPLPYAPDRTAWSWLERSELGVHGTADVLYRMPTSSEEEGAELPARMLKALPLLLHETRGLELADLPGAPEDRLGLSPVQALRRVMPRLLNYRWIDSERMRELVYGVGRPSSLHVLARVLDSSYRFRLEDLSHFATHGELVVEALDRLEIENALDPEAILYCPALDSPYPFKFVVGQGAAPNRATYIRILSKILRQTESDETFRARQFKELTRGFQKFGPAAATPQFQEVELRIWRLLSYLAARLRVKAGRLTDTKDPAQARLYLSELREVHDALDEVEHLPSRTAAFYRSRFDLEFSKLSEHVLPELERIAKRIDCELTDRERSIDAVAGLVAEFRRLGSCSPLEALEEKDRDIKVAYGDVQPEALETGWARAYTDAIHTGAERFDTRRFGSDRALELGGGEENLDLELDFLNQPAQAQPEAPAAAPTVAADDDDAEAVVEDDEAPADDEALSDSAQDWRVQPGAEWTMPDLDAVLGSDDGTIPPDAGGDDEDEDAGE
jgi:hypothetical protein